MRKAISIALLLTLIPAFAWSACPAPVGTTYTAVDASETEVQSCVDAANAAAGGTVVIPAGSATYSTGVVKTLTNDLIIQGAGTGAGGTLITSGSATAPCFYLKADGTVAVTLKNIKVTLVDGNNTNGVVNIYGTSSNRLLTGMYFDMTPMSGHSGRAVIWGNPNDATQGGGVIYSNTFYNNGTNGQGITIHGNAAGANYYWTGNPTWGTAAGHTYIEGNTFTFANGKADGAFDAYSGVRVTFRYNTVSGTDIGWHGNDSSTSPHSFEIYKNSFVSAPSSVNFLSNARGGTALIYDNITDSSYAAGMTLALYRTVEATGRGATKCQGAGEYDGNTTGGYRCYQQPGSTGTNGITQWPIIAWNNKANGSDIHFQLNANHAPPTCTETYCIADYLQAGRDYVDHDTCVGVTSDFCAAWWDDVNKKGKANGSAYTALACPDSRTGLTGACTTTAGTGGYNVATTHTVTVSTSTGCTVSNSGANTVGDGETLAVTMTAAYGYDITATGCTLSGSTCTTAAVTGNLAVSCNPVPHFATLGGSGTVTLGGSGTATLGN